MLVAIFGESCVGKTTLAERLRAALGAQVYTGRDYRRLAKNEDEARRLFAARLREAVAGGDAVWVISEKEDLALLPPGAVRVLMTAALPLIQARFAERLHGQLPPPVAGMLARRHGSFDGEAHDFHAVSPDTDLDALCDAIRAARP